MDLNSMDCLLYTYPFIAINTAAIPKELLESELFGHERGAFTGAAVQRRGRFEQAEGGTLFLDEIGDMPSELQTRLLRVLSDGNYYRVRRHSPIKANVRIIAATHQNLENRVKEGLFREDLFHRLNVIRVRLPSLREMCIRDRGKRPPTAVSRVLRAVRAEAGVACDLRDAWRRSCRTPARAPRGRRSVSYTHLDVYKGQRRAFGMQEFERVRVHVLMSRLNHGATDPSVAPWATA